MLPQNDDLCNVNSPCDVGEFTSRTYQDARRVRNAQNDERNFIIVRQDIEILQKISVQACGPKQLQMKLLSMIA